MGCGQQDFLLGIPLFNVSNTIIYEVAIGLIANRTLS